MATTLGVEKLQEVLKKGKEPHLLTGEQFKESLRDGRHVVGPDGRRIEDVTQHPVLGRTVERLARVMDMQHEPQWRDSLTYTENGARYALGWQIPTTKQHLYDKLKSVEATTRETLGMFGRPNDYGAMMAIGFLATIDRVEKENKEFADNIRGFVNLGRKLNVHSTDLIADAQSDRRIPLPKKPGRLRIIEDRKDGVVLYGSKVAGSIGACCHFFTLSTTLGRGLEEDAAVWCAVPVNSKNLSLVMREPLTEGEKFDNSEDHPLDSRGEEIDNFLVFDGTFIPHEYVFSVRNLDLLDLYFESCAHALWHILARLAVRAEMFVGVAQVTADMLGTDTLPGVRNMISQIAMYAGALRSFVKASIEEAVEWNGIMTPNPPLVTCGRLYSIQYYPEVQYLLRDICGQGLVSRFPSKVWDDAYFGKKLEEFLPGTGYTAREKNRWFNFVWDLTAGAHAMRVGQFENVNATPRYFISELIYKHYDRSKWMKVAREIAGVPLEPHT